LKIEANWHKSCFPQNIFFLHRIQMQAFWFRASVTGALAQGSRFKSGASGVFGKVFLVPTQLGRPSLGSLLEGSLGMASRLARRPTGTLQDEKNCRHAGGSWFQ